MNAKPRAPTRRFASPISTFSTGPPSQLAAMVPLRRKSQAAADGSASESVIGSDTRMIGIDQPPGDTAAFPEILARGWAMPSRSHVVGSTSQPSTTRSRAASKLGTSPSSNLNVVPWTSAVPSMPDTERPVPDSARTSRVGEIRVDPVQAAVAGSNAGAGGRSRTSRQAGAPAIVTPSPDTVGADGSVRKSSRTANPRYASAGAALTTRRARIQTVPGSRLIR